ncbi:translation initiation factor IF-2-like [Monodelphis domestica]|uniref:translation initiation factor IF-2-like n=1 Tax=Monodelphis domestica TaxID=13616 RepID=UPI0024E1E95C|nr:translation initiation factor IF-2-like [Monodelphis domestica]
MGHPLKGGARFSHLSLVGLEAINKREIVLLRKKAPLLQADSIRRLYRQSRAAHNGGGSLRSPRPLGPPRPRRGPPFSPSQVTRNPEGAPAPLRDQVQLRVQPGKETGCRAVPRKCTVHTQTHRRVCVTAERPAFYPPRALLGADTGPLAPPPDTRARPRLSRLLASPRERGRRRRRPRILLNCNARSLGGPTPASRRPGAGGSAPAGGDALVGIAGARWAPAPTRTAFSAVQKTAPSAMVPVSPTWVPEPQRLQCPPGKGRAWPGKRGDGRPEIRAAWRRTPPEEQSQAAATAAVAAAAVLGLSPPPPLAAEALPVSAPSSASSGPKQKRGGATSEGKSGSWRKGGAGRKGGTPGPVPTCSSSLRSSEHLPGSYLDLPTGPLSRTPEFTGPGCRLGRDLSRPSAPKPHSCDHGRKPSPE